MGTEPSPSPVTVTLIGLDPAAGSALASGTSFKISYRGQYPATNASGFRVHVFAFVSDDGRYSPPFICAGSRVGGGYAVEEQDLRGVVATDRVGHILHEFGKGHRVNLVLLLKVVPDLTLPLVGCGPLGTDVPGLNNSNNPTEGTVFPDNADQRVDLPLNWFIQP